MAELRGLSSRQALLGGLAIVSAATLVACSGSTNDTASPKTRTPATSAAVATASTPAGLPALGVELPAAPPDGQPLVAPLSLYLLAPAGGRYAIATLPVEGMTDKNPGHVPDLVDWSGDGKHALFEDRASCPSSFVDHEWRCNDPGTPEQHTTMIDVDLTTGAKQTFTVDHWAGGS